MILFFCKLDIIHKIMAFFERLFKEILKNFYLFKIHSLGSTMSIYFSPLIAHSFKWQIKTKHESLPSKETKPHDNSNNNNLIDDL